MSQLTPADHPSRSATPADPAAPVIEPGFEVALHAYWQKNQNLVLLACAVILVGIIGWKGMEYFAEQRELGVQADYARISDQPAKLGAFAEDHAGHALAGIAWLRLADDKYTAGDYAAAAANYQKAAGSLKNEALLGRARLGAAVSQLNNGDRAGSLAALKALGADATVLKGVRAEATYDQAVLAAEAGNADEVRQLVDQVSRIDAASPWSQRATVLLTALPADGKPAAGVMFKPGK